MTKQIRVFKDTKKRANEFAQYTAPDGTRYHQVPRDLLEWADVAFPPDDYSDETYYRTEQDDAPYVVYTRKSDEQIRQAQLAKIVPISPRQIRMALSRAGLRTTVETAVAAGDQDLKDWYEFSTAFERTNAQVTAMGAALGQTEQQLDDLWALGASL